MGFNMMAYEYASSRIWAIKEDNLRNILEISLRMNDPIEAIEARLGRPLDNTQVSSVRDGVAVIPVRGPIMKYGGLFEKVSGATSCSTLAKDFTSALENPDVKSILFDVDSPGGEASGINELSEMIYNARGTKPLVAYVSGTGCSAAYWIASSCDKIYADETAVLGSVGVAAVIKDSEEKDAREGIKNIKFVSSGSANKRPDLNTDEGKALLQGNIDAIANVFRAKVARNRSNGIDTTLSAEDIIQKFNEGGTLVGVDAVSAGMADEIGSFESVLASLKDEGEQPQIRNNMETSMKLDETTKIEAEASALTQADFDALNAQLTTANSQLETANSLNETLQDKINSFDSVIENLKTQVATLEADKLETATNLVKVNATSLADKFKDKQTPAQRNEFVATYIKLATEDDKYPVEGFKRVDSLVAMWETAPIHKMTEELLETTTLENDTEEEDAVEAQFKSLDAMALEYSTRQNQIIKNRKKA